MGCSSWGRAFHLAYCSIPAPPQVPTAYHARSAPILGPDTSLMPCNEHAHVHMRSCKGCATIHSRRIQKVGSSTAAEHPQNAHLTTFPRDPMGPTGLRSRYFKTGLVVIAAIVRETYPEVRIPSHPLRIQQTAESYWLSGHPTRQKLFISVWGECIAAVGGEVANSKRIFRYVGMR